ncbi:hypothetical protein EG329_006661 [Mollisiaceae sp. DMI_Dod_QoI]|nr:hypothetical protein EG329_006661 [Helotiales sp. DMI_Dod_QoI]
MDSNQQRKRAIDAIFAANADRLVKEKQEGIAQVKHLSRRISTWDCNMCSLQDVLPKGKNIGIMCLSSWGIMTLTPKVLHFRVVKCKKLVLLRSIWLGRWQAGAHCRQGYPEIVQKSGRMRDVAEQHAHEVLCGHCGSCGEDGRVEQATDTKITKTKILIPLGGQNLMSSLLRRREDQHVVMVAR